MTINRDIWKKWMTGQELIVIPCQNCRRQGLINDKYAIRNNESISSIKYRERNNEGFDHTSYDGYFSAMFKCNSCNESIHMVGITCYDYCRNASPREPELELYYSPKCIIPTPDIFEIIKNVPESVAKELRKAFQLFWMDYSACGNRLRVAIEKLLDRFKIGRFPRKGKRRPISLHKRIDIFKEKYPKYVGVSWKLMAIKWVANEASHDSNLDIKDVLDAMDILEYVLDELFKGKNYSIFKKVAEINKKHFRKKHDER